MPAAPAILETRIRRVASVNEDATDCLAVEEPLEIQIRFASDGKRIIRPISVTMRTPGDDDELAAGFLFTEGIVRSPDEVTRIHPWPSSVQNKNTILIELRDDVVVDLDRLQRHFYT